MEGGTCNSGMCRKCCKITGGLVLLTGLYFIGGGLGWFPTGDVSMWAVLVAVIGLGMCGKSKCTDCK